VSIRRLESRALEKVWGSPDTEPWYPRGTARIGEVWFSAPEEPRLLVKFLFTSQKLSVQVHPPASAAGPGKTEMWRILRAQPDAAVALGFEHPLSREEARAAALSGEIERLLHWYRAQPGDTFFVPAGTVHAIGAGLVLCEIQQATDVTYRLYDYGRPRELHLEQALAVAHWGGHPGPVTSVVECPYFRTQSVSVTGALSFASGPRNELLVCLQGRGEFDGQTFAPGEVWVVPAGTERFTIRPREAAEFLRTYVPE
jgi:mannose-6-phosphate isomerase